MPASRKGGAQAVEDRLVGDFAREPHIARRDCSDARAHQRAAPVRRRAGEVRDAACAPSRARKSATGSPALDSTSDAPPRIARKKDLQAAIAADVVEGAPHHGAVETLSGADRRGQAGQAVHDHLRHAGRAGGEQHPFGRQLRQRKLLGLEQWPARKRHAREDRAPGGPAYPRRSTTASASAQANQSAEVIGCGIGRQNRHPARHAVELDQRQRLVSWLDVATTTERPASSASRPPKLVPRAR